MESQSERKIWQVSELNHAIKGVLEDRYAFIWVTGEISDFRTPVSGHGYFTLKDGHSQIAAVMFKGQRRNLKLTIEDGLKVLGFGRISVYEPKGAYQIILEYLEPAGRGSQLLALEQLKKRLSAEGLFDPSHKKAIPVFPKNICLITSPTGAAVRDFIKVMRHRFDNMTVEILPVRVQGPGAEQEIASAIAWMNRLARADVGILTRGGGSAEDLSVFNSETMARAIFASKIPIVSAVGHEIDFTIADLTADLRAPTPSAAAEQVIPEKRELLERISQRSSRLAKAMERVLIDSRGVWISLKHRLADPSRKAQAWRLRLDDLQARLIQRAESLVRIERERLGWRTRSLSSHRPLAVLQQMKARAVEGRAKLLNAIDAMIHEKRRGLREVKRMLVSLGPLNILARGYSITRFSPDGPIVMDAAKVSQNAAIEVILHKGALDALVRSVRLPNEDTDH